MNFCSQCGGILELKVPPDDNRKRHICVECETVHYQNPKIVAGCIPEFDNRILICKRAIEPRYGYWTLPAGFMELGETSPQAAARETLEEAKARVKIVSLFSIFNLPHVNQVYMMFRARLADVEFSPGDETLEVKLCQEDEIPWKEIAFTTVKQTMRLYFEDRKTGKFRIHTGDIIKKDDSYEFLAGPEDLDHQL